MCDLCKLANGNIITKCYYNGEDFLIVDCSSCKIPMCVAKEHILIPSVDLEDRIKKECRRLFGEDIKFREPRSIIQHYHLHVIKSWLRNKKQLC